MYLIYNIHTRSCVLVLFLYTLSFSSSVFPWCPPLTLCFPPLSFVPRPSILRSPATIPPPVYPLLRLSLFHQNTHPPHNPLLLIPSSFRPYSSSSSSRLPFLLLHLVLLTSPPPLHSRRRIFGWRRIGGSEGFVDSSRRFRRGVGSSGNSNQVVL